MKKCIVLFTSLLVVCILCGCGSNTPTEAYNKVAKHVENREWDKFYDCFSQKSQGQLDITLKMLMGLESGFSQDAKKDIEGKTGKEFFVALMSTKEASDGLVALGKVRKEKIEGDTVVLTVKSEDGEEDVNMVRENGEWKLYFSM